MSKIDYPLPGGRNETLDQPVIDGRGWDCLMQLVMQKFPGYRVHRIVTTAESGNMVVMKCKSDLFTLTVPAITALLTGEAPKRR